MQKTPEFSDPDAHKIEVSTQDVENYVDAAIGTGVKVQVEADEGAEYTTSQGQERRVEAGNVLISVGKGNPNLGSHNVSRVAGSGSCLERSFPGWFK